MNTPAHAAVNLLLLGGRDATGASPPESPPPTGHLVAVTVGAVLPDAPMLLFYGVEKLRGVPESVIWSLTYHHPDWQTLFDLVGSLPLIIVALVIARRLAAPRLFALLASMGLHALCDLPLHHDDAHRHLWPLSDWRFRSPVSYWDPAHHGTLFAVLEIALVVLATATLLRRHGEPRARLLVAMVALTYLLYLGFALWAWV